MCRTEDTVFLKKRELKDVKGPIDFTKWFFQDVVLTKHGKRHSEPLYSCRSTSELLKTLTGHSAGSLYTSMCWRSNSPPDYSSTWHRIYCAAFESLPGSALQIFLLKDGC